MHASNAAAVSGHASASVIMAGHCDTAWLLAGKAGVERAGFGGFGGSRSWGGSVCAQLDRLRVFVVYSL